MNSSDKLIEQVLILRCQIGDKDALAGLIKRYQAPLRYFISRLSAVRCGHAQFEGLFVG
jgi:hypothetical protein